MLESGVAGLGAVQVEALETFPVFDGGDTFIGDVLGESRSTNRSYRD